MSRKLLFATVACATIAGSMMNHASATPIGGGPVDSAVFTAAGLGTTGWAYQSNNLTFSGSATGTLELSLANYNDTFGYSNTSHGQSQTIFNAGQADGTTATINPSFNPYLLWFMSPGGSGNPSDSPATLYSNGTTSGTDSGQAGLATYYNSTTQTYAFFFDDGGPAGETCSGSQWNRRCDPNDDNDFNDMVVQYKKNPTAVPEPGSLALLGAGLFGLGMIRRRKSASKA